MYRRHPATQQESQKIRGDKRQVTIAYRVCRGTSCIGISRLAILRHPVLTCIRICMHHKLTYRPRSLVKSTAGSPPGCFGRTDSDKDQRSLGSFFGASWISWMLMAGSSQKIAIFLNWTPSVNAERIFCLSTCWFLLCRNAAALCGCNLDAQRSCSDPLHCRQSPLNHRKALN